MGKKDVDMQEAPELLQLQQSSLNLLDRHKSAAGDLEATNFVPEVKLWLNSAVKVKSVTDIKWYDDGKIIDGILKVTYNEQQKQKDVKFSDAEGCLKPLVCDHDFA